MTLVNGVNRGCEQVNLSMRKVPEGLIGTNMRSANVTLNGGRCRPVPYGQTGDG